MVEINLSEVRPTVAFPHLPGNGHTIDEIEEMDKIYIDQVVIGSCTNGRLSDLEKAAAILKGKKSCRQCTCDGRTSNTKNLLTMYSKRLS